MKLFKNILLSSIIITGSFVAGAQTWVTNGLIAYYPFSGNAIDQTGNGNTATSVVGTYGPDRFGNSTNALALDGVNSGMVVSGFFYNYSSNFPSYSPLPLTESIWFCPSNDLTLTNPYTLVTAGSSYNAGYGFSLDDTGYGPEAYYYSSSSGGHSAKASLTNFSANVWYHIVGVMTVTNVEIFVNGVLQNNLVFPTTYPSTYSDLDIGAQQWNGGTGYRFGFVGRVDDARIYNRALSPTEVTQLYTMEAPALTISVASAVVPTFQNLSVGSSYVLQVSTAVNGPFTDYGSSFTATNSTMDYPGYFKTASPSQLYFRLSSAQ